MRWRTVHTAGLLLQEVILLKLRLWNELTLATLHFVYHPSVKGKVTFAFYS